MTVGIGVLASDKSTPDTVILVADTKGSFGQTHSMNRLHKIFSEPRVGLHAVAAGKIDRASELFAAICKLLNEYLTEGRYGDVLDAVHAASDIYKRLRFRFDILPQYAHSPASLKEPFTHADLAPALLEEWRKFHFGCQMIIGAFNKARQPSLFWIDGTGQVENFTFPGFAAIGSGAKNAMFWLSYRNHNLAMSLKRAAYHAFEAKIMAESSPFVNEKADILIADSENIFSITDFKPVPKGAPVTLKELRQKFRTYGPKGTDGLEKKHKT